MTLSNGRSEEEMEDVLSPLVVIEDQPARPAEPLLYEVNFPDFRHGTGRKDTD